MKKAKTPTKTTGTGVYDNGQYPQKYNKTSYYEVSVSYYYGKTYVTYTEINNENKRGAAVQSPIEAITNKAVLSAAQTLLN